MLTVPTAPKFLYYSDLVINQRGEGFVWSISVIVFTFLTVFWFLGGCRNGIFWLTCHNDRMCRIGQDVLVPLAPKLREHVDEIGLYWLLEGSSFDPIRLFFRRGEFC